MNRTRRLLALVALGAFLVAGTAACGSSGGSDSGGSDGGSGDAAQTTAAPSDSGTDDTAADTGGGTDGEQDCAASADSDKLSGDSVVLFSADQSEQSETDLTDDQIAVIAADGSSMEPGTLEVEAGQIFGIKADEGASIDAVVIGCAGGQTLVPGTAIGFVITEPGTYPVSLDITGAELGSVVVS